MTTATDTTMSSISNTTHIYDTYDLFIHPHWKQFPLIPEIWHYAIGVFITFVGISGTLGNLLVIYIFGTTKSLRTPSNMFVVNLALSDLTFSAVNGFPLLTISAFNKRWIFGKVACELYGLIGGIFGLMSINTMAAIAIDRYNVIARPIKASRSLSYRKAFFMIVFVWMWSITWTIPPLFGWGAYIPEGFQTSCTFDYLTRNNFFRSYIMCLYVCGFCLPLSTIIYCYFFIYRAVAKHEKEMGKMAKKLNAEIRQGQAQQKAEIKTAKIAMTIILFYLISWLPYATVALIAQFGPAEYVTPYVSELPVMFAKASAMHNPIIYALSHPRFREVLNQRFPWLLCCCRYSKKEAESAAETKSKVSRMDSVNSNAPGGNVSNMSSEVSNLSDSAYTSNLGEGGERHVSMKMRNMRGQAENPENDRALIRDILQAFVGVVNAQGSRQLPDRIPPQYLSQCVGQLPPAAKQVFLSSSSRLSMPSAREPYLPTRCPIHLQCPNSPLRPPSLQQHHSPQQNLPQRPSNPPSPQASPSFPTCPSQPVRRRGKLNLFNRRRTSPQRSLLRSPAPGSPPKPRLTRMSMRRIRKTKVGVAGLPYVVWGQDGGKVKGGRGQTLVRGWSAEDRDGFSDVLIGAGNPRDKYDRGLNMWYRVNSDNVTLHHRHVDTIPGASTCDSTASNDSIWITSTTRDLHLSSRVNHDRGQYKGNGDNTEQKNTKTSMDQNQLPLNPHGCLPAESGTKPLGSKVVTVESWHQDSEQPDMNQTHVREDEMASEDDALENRQTDSKDTTPDKTNRIINNLLHNSKRGRNWMAGTFKRAQVHCSEEQDSATKNGEAFNSNIDNNSSEDIDLGLRKRRQKCSKQAKMNPVGRDKSEKTQGFDELGAIHDLV